MRATSALARFSDVKKQLWYKNAYIYYFIDINWSIGPINMKGENK